MHKIDIPSQNIRRDSMLSILLGYLGQILGQFFLHGYVSGGYTFPKPLSAKEEEKYLELHRQGDEEARRILIEHNLRLVAHIAKKYSPVGTYDVDDLISIGSIGLIKAIDSFDSNKNIRLATYASRCIANEILMVLRANKNHTRETSLQEPIGTDSEGNTISLLSILCSDEEDIEDGISLKIQIKKLYNAIGKKLLPRERQIIGMRYGLDGNDVLTQREIAGKLDISRSYVSRIETKAINKLKEEFVDDEK